MFVERKDVVEPGSKRACVRIIVLLRCVGLDRWTWVILLRRGLLLAHLTSSTWWADVGAASDVGGSRSCLCGGSWSALLAPVLWVGLSCDMLAGPVWLDIMMVLRDVDSLGP
jgi:hypothetical protein